MRPDHRAVRAALLGWAYLIIGGFMLVLVALVAVVPSPLADAHPRVQTVERSAVHTEATP